MKNKILELLKISNKIRENYINTYKQNEEWIMKMKSNYKMLNKNSSFESKILNELKELKKFNQECIEINNQMLSLIKDINNQVNNINNRFVAIKKDVKEIKELSIISKELKLF